MLVGTSGWQYADWRGVFYPAGVPRRAWLRYYADRFATVECNNAFYRLPAPGVVARWREQTPPGFIMTVKASRFLTHVRRLRDPAEPVERFLAHTAGLGHRLGPVLLQLPPNLRADPVRLDACLGCFPSDVRVVVEPRHPSWWTSEVHGVLRAHDTALCWADRDSRPVTPLWRPAGWGYLRLHAGRARPAPRYGRQALSSWIRRIAECWPEGDAYVYFNNDHGGAAVHDAAEFARMAVRAGLPTSRVPASLPAVSATAPVDRTRGREHLEDQIVAPVPSTALTTVIRRG
nr:DUF72 domain-containing protein [Protofrankia sp. BMG5.30]